MCVVIRYVHRIMICDIQSLKSKSFNEALNADEKF